MTPIVRSIFKETNTRTPFWTVVCDILNLSTCEMRFSLALFVDKNECIICDELVLLNFSPYNILVTVTCQRSILQMKKI